MADVPWHLRVLGLPPYADTGAVRRAYALALRGIDPATDPAAFGRLRAAYEAARTWCEHPEDDALVVPAEPIDTPPSEEHASSPATESDADSRDMRDARREAEILVEGFIIQARQLDDAAAVAALSRTVAALRTRYIDAPGEFEGRLIDLLANEALPHRAALFAKASALFHWTDVGQLASLDERGRWIEVVFAQREAWLPLPASWRAHWLKLMSNAAHGLDATTIRQWPDIDVLHTQYPQWINLHLDTRVRHAWRHAFDAWPDQRKKESRQRAAPAEAFRPKTAVRKKRGSRPWLRFAFWLIVGIAVHVAHFFQGEHGHAPSDADNDTFMLPDDTEGTCADLYARLDKPDAFTGVPASEVQMLKTRGARCVRMGYWHAPTPTALRSP